jgi:hypothetical protein
LVTRFPPKGIRDYGTEQSYMKTDLGHATGSLKEPAVVELPQSFFPSVGRDTRRGISPPSWKSRWAHPYRDGRTRISLPFRLPVDVELRAVLPGSLEGCS